MNASPIRSRLAGSHGRLYWRSLGELADTLEFREYLHREFPEQASEWNDPKGRRTFLKLMSASLALAGVGACTKQPPEQIIPYVRRPTKIEGNPEHPASLGATDVLTQAAVLGLYDPDRAQTVTYRGEVRTWGAFQTSMQTALAVQKAGKGSGLRIL